MLGMEALPRTWEAKAQSNKFKNWVGTRFHDETLSQTSKMGLLMPALPKVRKTQEVKKKSSYMCLLDTN